MWMKNSFLLEGDYIYYFYSLSSLMFQILSTLLVGYGVILLGDFIWLGYVIKDFTIREFHNLIIVENGSIRLNIIA